MKLMKLEGEGGEFIKKLVRLPELYTSEFNSSILNCNFHQLREIAALIQQCLVPVSLKNKFHFIKKLFNFVIMN